MPLQVLSVGSNQKGGTNIVGAAEGHYGAS